MTHQERIERAIQHRDSDRIPTGEWIVDKQLMARLVDKQVDEFDSFGDTVNVWQMLDLDLKGVDCTFESSPYQERVGTHPSGRAIIRDGWGAVYEDSEFGSLTAGLLECPIKRPEGVYDYVFPPLDYYESHVETITRWVKETDLFIGAGVWGAFTLLWPLMGYENYMVWSLTHPEELTYIIEEFAKYNAEVAKRYLDAGARAILIQDDLGYNDGAFMAPSFYREILLPALREQVRRIKAHAAATGTDCAVFFHSDGDINWILDDLTAIGIDGLHPLEPAAGMDIRQVKARYGDTLCLMGNVDTRYVLPRGTPAEVAADVRRVIDSAGTGGGLIVASANMFTADIPVDNVLAVQAAVKGYGSNVPFPSAPHP